MKSDGPDVSVDLIKPCFHLVCQVDRLPPLFFGKEQFPSGVNAIFQQFVEVMGKLQLGCLKRTAAFFHLADDEGALFLPDDVELVVAELDGMSLTSVAILVDETTHPEKLVLPIRFDAMAHEPDFTPANRIVPDEGATNAGWLR